MKELKRTSTIVLKILKEDENSRKDDLYLYEETLDSIIPGISEWVKKIHNLMRAKRLPTWETMRRTRQKVQAYYPELKDKRTAKCRADKEKEYREFARS